MLGRLHEGNDSCGGWPANSDPKTVSKTAQASKGQIRGCERAINQHESDSVSRITGDYPMTSQQPELIARRGLTLPEPTLTRLRTVGIWCEANLTVQRRDQDWLIRGQELGGAVNDIGRYVSFCKEDGSALSWLQPVKNFMPNGLHAILLAKGPIVRLICIASKPPTTFSSPATRS